MAGVVSQVRPCTCRGFRLCYDLVLVLSPRTVLARLRRIRWTPYADACKFKGLQELRFGKKSTLDDHCRVSASPQVFIASPSATVQQRYKTSWDCAKAIVKEEGVVRLAPHRGVQEKRRLMNCVGLALVICVE